MISPAAVDAALDAVAFTRALITGDEAAQWVILNNTPALDLINALGLWWAHDLTVGSGGEEAAISRLAEATQGLAGAS